MTTLIVVSLLILGFGLVSERLHRSSLTPPMVFVAVGLAMGAGYITNDAGETEGLLELLAEVTLILVLFTDASRIRLAALTADYALPFRLLAIGMPLAIVFGAVVAHGMFPDLTTWECVVLATVLAPTDAALGQAVVSSPAVPARIRQALNVESGLNDGIAFPLVLVALAFASSQSGPPPANGWGMFTAKQIILGPIVGAAIGAIGGRLVDSAARARWMEHTFQQLSALALAILAFLLSEEVGGNGFMAAFAAGLALGNTGGKTCLVLQEFSETEGQLLGLLTFLCVGAHLIAPNLHRFTLTHVVYAVMSLTLARAIPVALSLVGTRLRPGSVAFLGWFGPRGLATVLFALMVFESSMPHRETIYLIAILTIAMSVVAHGATAWPASVRFAHYCTARTDGAGPSLAEHAPAAELPVRITFRERDH